MGVKSCLALLLSLLLSQVPRRAVYAGCFRLQAASCCAYCTWGLKPPFYLLHGVRSRYDAQCYDSRPDPNSAGKARDRFAHVVAKTQKRLARLACAAKSGERRNQSRYGCVICGETSVSDPISLAGSIPGETRICRWRNKRTLKSSKRV